jgi:hypothetical protein
LSTANVVPSNGTFGGGIPMIPFEPRVTGSRFSATIRTISPNPSVTIAR